MSGDRNNLDQVRLAMETLRVFVDHGENLSDVRHVIHFFYGGNFEGLGAALTELGYSVRATVDDDGVVAERHEVIGEDWRCTTLRHLCELADTYDVEYDGWEASMTGAGQPPVDQMQEPSVFAKIFGKKN